MTRRARVIAYGSCGLLVLAGVLVALFVAGTTGQLITFILVALGLVCATSLVFYEVGLSEDRALEREARKRSARRSPRRRVRKNPRLGRERDHERRLR